MKELNEYQKKTAYDPDNDHLEFLRNSVNARINKALLVIIPKYKSFSWIEGIFPNLYKLGFNDCLHQIQNNPDNINKIWKES